MVDRPVLNVNHSLNGYRKGCRCKVCRAAKSADDAQRKRPEGVDAVTDVVPGAVTPPSPVPPTTKAVGPVEAAVRKDFAEFAGAEGSEVRLEVAVALAVEIDGRVSASVAAACKQLLAAYAEAQKENRHGDDELAQFLDAMGAKA